MNKRKILAEVYKDNPWIQDMVSSLEAQISTLASQRVILDQDYEDSLEENDEMADTILRQSKDLREAHASYASLNSRYQVLLNVVAKITQERKNEQEED